MPICILNCASYFSFINEVWFHYKQNFSIVCWSEFFVGNNLKYKEVKEGGVVLRGKDDNLTFTALCPSSARIVSFVEST